MQKAKIFPIGRGQAVRLPESFRFDGEEVYIIKRNGIVMLFPVADNWDVLRASLDMFSDDFMAERNAPEREQVKTSRRSRTGWIP